MPRKGVRDLAKEQHWRAVIDEWRSSNKNAADFCRTHGHKYFQFQDWQKIIRDRDAQLAAQWKNAQSPRAGASRKVQKTKPASAHFVQARITDPLHAKSDLANESKVEILLPCGMVLRITAECSPKFLASVITALENRSC
jgi:hypothetical protein